MKTNFVKFGIVVSPLLLLVMGSVFPVNAEPYGWSPDVDNSWKGPPRCGDPTPKSPILYEPNHRLLPKAKEKGAIRLQWTRVPGANNYSVFYGLTPQNYIYSGADVGDTDNFTVRFLANKKYYFAVTARVGCAGSPKSNEWAGRPGGGGVSLAAYGFTPVKKVTTPKQVLGTDSIGSPSTSEVTSPPVEYPTSPPAVQGVETYTPQNETPKPPVAQAPVAPKKKGFWETLLSIFFGK